MKTIIFFEYTEVVVNLILVKVHKIRRNSWRLRFLGIGLEPSSLSKFSSTLAISETKVSITCFIVNKLNPKFNTFFNKNHYWEINSETLTFYNGTSNFSAITSSVRASSTTIENQKRNFVRFARARKYIFDSSSWWECWAVLTMTLSGCTIG